MVIWEHKGNVETRAAFSTFIECSQMTGVFYHSVIHGLGFFTYFKYRFYTRKTIKHTFSVLYSDKTWVFDQSERAQGPISILIWILNFGTEENLVTNGNRVYVLELSFW